MDGVIQFLDIDGNLRVLCVGEGKKHSASKAAVRLCEDQALDACRQYLATHDQNNLYAVTYHGTRAKPWYYEKGNNSLIAMDPEIESPDSSTLEGYIEAHSSQAEKLTASFQRMKTFPTAVLASTGPSPAFPRTTIFDSRANTPQGNAQSHGQDLYSRHTPATVMLPPPVQTGARHSVAGTQSGQKKWEMVAFRRDQEGSNVGFFRKQGEEQWHVLTKDWRRQEYEDKDALVNNKEKLYLFLE
jgi:hypothetical protein